MASQKRTVLPVPTTHLQPNMVSPTTVQRRLQDNRRKQRHFCKRGTQPLPDLRTGSTATMDSAPSETWSAVKALQPAETPRAYIVAKEEGRKFQPAREHLRPTRTSFSENHVTPTPQPLVPAEGTSEPSESTELRRAQASVNHREDPPGIRVLKHGMLKKSEDVT
ncbi:hypothetical protein HPB49_025185 [Dermacentor silvarum]|uniref:Uncharacterized protein n=1 Tax=Dermacentor silvarum TaxID=543639 RepID=A0ACB8CIE9_DERSI|nr:hypothetical protein HPB49_025185 [Dermacentor silvarum]